MNESLFKKYEKQKADSFKQNELLNDLLSQLKELLGPIQREEESKTTHNKWPIGFIVGCPRSGTTLLLQWMAGLNVFAYPTNFLTRFAYAPYVGALIQKMLFDNAYDYHGDFKDIQSNINYTSNLGKSKGALATNEFQHYFRNYMSNFDPEYIDEETIKKVDFEGLKKGIGTIEHVFEKPFITKAFMLQYNLLDVYNAIPLSLFIYIKRDPIINMQSILLAREKYYNTSMLWLGPKPREYSCLRNMDVYHQIAGQVYFTNKSIKEELGTIPEQNKMIVEYEKFCIEPEFYYKILKEKYEHYNYLIDKNYNGVKNFAPSNSVKLDDDVIKKLENAYKNIASKERCNYD